jgi:outer membrane lipoprotein-sorting protein
MRPEDEIKRLVKDAKVIIDPAVKRDALKELIDQLEKPETIRSAETEPNTWRIIMKSRTIKLAAAAVIMIAVILGLPFLPKSTTSPTLAEILEKVEQTKAYIYKMNVKVTGPMMPGWPMGQDMTATVTISKDLGTKMEMEMINPDTGETTTQENYIIFDERLMVMLMHEKKQFTRAEINDDLLARMKKQNNDPREMIRQMLDVKCTELGKSEIDGVEVDGFETTDPAISDGTTGDVKVTLWVDSKSWLPYLAEMDMSINEQTRSRSTFYDYRWDVPVEKSEFVPVIPDHYEALFEDQKWPEMTEEAAIEGLKLVADLVGRYPKKVSIVDLMAEISPIMFEHIKKDLPEDVTDIELETKMMEAIQPVYPIGLFYMALVEDKKEPVYYGRTVGPDDVDAILMRWKINDNEYRVIFGDLSAMDVSAEKLNKLENPSE